MRIIRIAVVIIFVMAVGVYGWAVYEEQTQKDPNRPQITSETERISLSCSYTDEEIMEGLQAWDEEDGDLTEEILLGGLSRFVSPGVCRATYVVFDSANQAATLTREVEFTDYISPRFTLHAPLVFEEGKSGNASTYVGATDVLDGDISDQVKMTDHTISYAQAGDYTMDVEVSNSFGDFVDVTFPVHVVEEEWMELTLKLKTNLVYLEKNSDFDAQGYVEAVYQKDGNEETDVTIAVESNVDPAVSGCYEVKYTAENAEGQKGITWLPVIVQE